MKYKIAINEIQVKLQGDGKGEAPFSFTCPEEFKSGQGRPGELFYCKDKHYCGNLSRAGPEGLLKSSPPQRFRPGMVEPPGMKKAGSHIALISPALAGFAPVCPDSRKRTAYQSLSKKNQFFPPAIEEIVQALSGKEISTAWNINGLFSSDITGMKKYVCCQSYPCRSIHVRVKKMDGQLLKKSPFAKFAGVIHSSYHAIYGAPFEIKEKKSKYLGALKKWVKYRAGCSGEAFYEENISDKQFPTSEDIRHILPEYFIFEKAFYKPGNDFNNPAVWLVSPFKAKAYLLEDSVRKEGR